MAKTTIKNGYETTNFSLVEFMDKFGELCTRSYNFENNSFVGILCISEDQEETFLSAPNKNNGHELEGYPYGGSQDDVEEFLVDNVDKLHVLHSVEEETGRTTNTLVFSDFPDTTRRVFTKKTV